MIASFSCFEDANPLVIDVEKRFTRRRGDAVLAKVL
jgi:hypothetical protein